MDIQLYSDDWYKTKGLWYRYYVTALAECGLTLENIEREYIEKAFSELETPLTATAEILCFFRSLVKLGYAMNLLCAIESGGRHIVWRKCE